MFVICEQCNYKISLNYFITTLNVAFLVIHSALKVLSIYLLTCCKQVHDQRTFPCMYCHNMMAGMHHVHYKSVYNYSVDGCDYASEFLKFLKVSFAFYLLKFIV